jgi:hypothetical protein
VQVLEQVSEQETEAFVAPALRWEPCASAVEPGGDGLCAGCGWPEHDHGEATAPAGAVVIPVPRRERPRLRRAS